MRVWRQEFIEIPLKPVTSAMKKKKRDTVTTKRELSSVTASVFDRLGIVLLITIKGRHFIHQLWETKCGWDNKITKSIKKELLNIYKDVQ